MMKKKNAICLLSGGLDSATTLYVAKSQGYQVSCLIFDYGQRHRKEIRLAKAIAQQAGCKWECIKIALPWQGSSLLNHQMKLPTKLATDENDIPSTYVPARNIIFLSFAASFAEALGAEVLFIGANAIDYSGYPDCRPAFFKAYQATLKQGLKVGVQAKPLKIKTPLIRKTKAQIIRLGVRLGVPYNLTWSCYEGSRRPCGFCDSCQLRAKGFESVGLKDPGGGA